MNLRIRTAIVACVGALVGAAGESALRWSRAEPALETLPVATATDTASCTETREQLRQRDGEIDKLRAEVQRLEAVLEEPREAVAPTVAVAAQDSTAHEDSAALARPTVESARLLLQTLLPDRYGSLTPEQAAALTNLDLHGTKATDADLAVLAVLPALTSISLRGTAVTDAGLVALASVPELTSVDLRATEISGAGLASLPLYKLDALHLTDTKVTGDDLRRLPSLPSLRVLKLNRLKVGDDALRSLPYLPALKHLELDGTSITALGLRDALTANPSLQRIEMRGTPVDQEALARLQTDYPAVEFVKDTPGDRALGFGR